MMRIGIDTTFLFDQYANRGIGTYGKELLKQLLIDPKIEWVLFGFKNLKANLNELGLKKANNISFVSFGKVRKSNPLNVLFFKFLYLRKIKRAKLDTYFATHMERGLPIDKVPTVVMMHDVIPYVTDKYSQKGKLINFLKGTFYKYCLNQARKADLILTNSDFTKRELTIKGGFDEKKIVRTYLAVNPHFLQEQITTDVREIRRTLLMYKVTQPYYLYYGGLEENKNIANLLRAFSKVVSRHPDLKLVIAGKEFKVGWDSKPKPQTRSAQELLNLILELQLKHKVILTGEIAGNHLPIVLKNAEGFIHLSTYEGFGFSVLEAASAGVPTIAARASSYPEILGEAALFVNPTDINKISEAILSITQDQKLRSSLIKKGIEISRKYSWPKTAEQTIASFNRINSRPLALKIGYLTPYFYPVQGGVENHTLMLAKQMVAEGHEVIVFTSDGKTTDLATEEIYEGIKIVRFKKINNQYYLGFYPGLFKALLFTKLDVLHVHGFGFIWHDFCLLFKRMFSKTKFINTPHGPFMAKVEYSLGQKILRIVYTFGQRLFLNFLYDVVIQVNPTQSEWITKYRINKSKIFYLPNAIEPKIFEILDTSKFEAEQNLSRKTVISFVGRLEKYKGVQDLIKATAEIIKAKSNLMVFIMGNTGNHLVALQKLIADKKLSRQVKIVIAPPDSYRDQVLQISDIFVMPSQWEAFGISILEAMAKYNAIVSTRTEGGNFLIKEEENGFLYDYGDYPELAKLILKLLADKKTLKQIQNNNFTKAQNFTIDEIAIKYNSLLKQISK